MMDLSRFLWENYWHLVCHRSELPDHGDFIKLQVLEFEVVIFNDNGELVAFDNRCPHRGARIYVESAGNQAATCIYHGWTYSGGRLIVPNAEQFASCDVRQADLKRWQIEWVGDFLFVGAQPKQPIDIQLGGLRAKLEDISFGIAGREDWNAYTFECDWKIAIENALEPYHISLVHPQSLGMLELSAGENSFDGVNSIWYAPVGNKRMAKQLSSLKRFFAIDYQYEGYMSIYMFPFTMLSSTYGYSYSLQSFLPSIQSDRTHFASRMLKMSVRAGVSPAVLTGFFESSAKVNRQVFDEDHKICRRMTTDSWSPNPPTFAADSEAKLLHFRQLCRQVLVENKAA